MRALGVALGSAALACAGCQRRDSSSSASGSGSASDQVSRLEPAAAPTKPPTPTPTPAPPPVPPGKDPHVPDPPPGQHRDVTALVGADARRAAIGDLDGDGKNEIVVADPNTLRVLDRAGKELASVPAPAGIQVLVIADRMVIAGWGESREHRGGPARIDAYRLDGKQLVAEPVVVPTTSRAEIAAIVPTSDADGHALLVAYFESQYMVKSQLARHSAKGWTLTDLATIRMAATYARADLDGDGKPELVVGRVYGDDKTKDGDAFVLGADGTRTPIPTLRGVRALAVGDVDDDGKPELYLADGWHQNYGQVAKGLVTRARLAGGKWTTDLVEDLDGQYTAGTFVVADVDGDGKPELVANGSNYVRMFKRAKGAWVGTTLALTARDLVAGELDGKPGAELLILGNGKSEIVSLRP